MTPKIIERFLIGGSPHHPSMPSKVLQEAIGTVIRVNMETQTLTVPTANGYKQAFQGDTIICYDNGNYDVEKRKD